MSAQTTGSHSHNRREHRLHFRRVSLHVIAIQVQVLRRRAPTRLLGAVLIRAIPAAEPLMAVHIERRNKQDGNSLESPGRHRAAQDVPQGHESRVLAVALARMNPTLKHEHRYFVGIGLRDQQCEHGSPFGRAPELDPPNGVGPFTSERFAKALHLVGAAGLPEARLLCDRL